MPPFFSSSQDWGHGRTSDPNLIIFLLCFVIEDRPVHVWLLFMKEAGIEEGRKGLVGHLNNFALVSAVRFPNEAPHIVALCPVADL